MFEDMTEDQILAWTAAFFEGEGSAGKHQVTISQKDREVIQALVDWFELGKVYEKEYDTGTIWYWHINKGREMDEFLEQIRPYLRFRRKEVDEVLNCDRGHAHWTDEERDYIRAHWTSKPDEGLAEDLDRTERGVAKRRREMGLLRTELQQQTGV